MFNAKIDSHKKYIRQIKYKQRGLGFFVEKKSYALCTEELRDFGNDKW